MRPFRRERLDAAYRYIETLSPELIAWELVRRDPEYQRDAEAEEAEDPELSFSTDRGRRWGMRYGDDLGEAAGEARGLEALTEGLGAGPPLSSAWIC